MSHDNGRYRAVRFDTNPLITPDLDESIGTNINGPSIIRVPPWADNALGRYYLYFAHHQGAHIRLAFADDLHGPWRVHGPGALSLEDTGFLHHIASPDVHIDHERRRFVMYYHGCVSEERHGMRGQRTGVATSGDGISFRDETIVPLGPFYARVFEFDGRRYALAKRIDQDGGGIILRGTTTASALCESEPMEHGPAVIPNMRHAAVTRTGDTLEVFYSRGEDCPERILRSTIDLTQPWHEWRASETEELLAPGAKYEGSDLPLEPSRFGAIHEPARQLRDPSVLVEDDGTYLFYSIAGESGIAGAELIETR
jgi:hypothetical protein